MVKYVTLFSLYVYMTFASKLSRQMQYEPNKVMCSVQYSVKAHEGISRKRVLLNVTHTWRMPLEQAGTFTKRHFSIRGI